MENVEERLTVVGCAVELSQISALLHIVSRLATDVVDPTMLAMDVIAEPRAEIKAMVQRLREFHDDLNNVAIEAQSISVRLTRIVT